MPINRELNLFSVEPKKRDYNRVITSGQRKKLFYFGKEYYDDPNFPGYRGYEYNGSWRGTAEQIVDFFNLKNGAKILDIGCAKGFFLHDLKMINQTFQVHGIDISKYAIENAMPSIKENLICTSCTDLPYEDSYFDLVLTTDTLHNLMEDDCRKAIREINRVGKKNNKFIMVHSYTNDIEKNNLINWEATIRLVKSVDEWKKIFKEENYDGFYYWKLFPNL